MKKLFALISVLTLSAALLAGCSVLPKTATLAKTIVAEEPAAAAPVAEVVAVPSASGGILCLKINPEIALHYDENGKVTKLEGRNPDGMSLLENYTGYIGKDTSQVLEELVGMIGQAGYFVEEADGTARKIVLELDPGSQVPHDQFLQDMAEHVKACVESKNWIGEREYEYPQQTTTPSATQPVATQKTGESVSRTTVPVTLCPVCGDDDCDDGKYCDDWDEKAENLREAENRKNGTPCGVCGDYDCDDGKYCDDWDDRYDHHDDDHHDWDD